MPQQRIRRDLVSEYPNGRWNFGANLLDIASFNLGMSFVFASTVMSLYASYLTSSAILIGLVPAVHQASYYLPQVLSARRGERLSQMKPVVARISVFERLPFLIIALSILLVPSMPRSVAYGILVGGLLLSSTAAGIATPMWKTMLSKVVHPDRRGTLFGTGFGLGALLGILGSTLSRRFLTEFEYPISFGLCFLAAFIGQVMSWTGLALNREPITPPDEKQLETREGMFGWIIDELRSNRNLRRYLISQTLVIFGTMGVSFYIVYSRSEFGITDGFAATLTMFALVSQAVGTLVLGRLADHMGHKWLTELAIAFGILAVLTIAFAQNQYWLYPVFFFMNLSLSLINVARMTITMEFSDSQKLPRVTAISNTTIAVPLFVAPLVGGWIIDSFGYPVLFVVTVSFSVAGWVILRFMVEEPRVTRRGVSKHR